MQFLSVSVRRLDRFADAEFEALVEAEARRARELYAEGFIRQIWRRSDQPGACILWEADSAEQVGDQLQTLPFIRAGMLEVSIVPLLPYAGFGTEGRLPTVESEVESEAERRAVDCLASQAAGLTRDGGR
jgi:muconolactone delta-isomerase